MKNRMCTEIKTYNGLFVMMISTLQARVGSEILHAYEIATKIMHPCSPLPVPYEVCKTKRPNPFLIITLCLK